MNVSKSLNESLCKDEGPGDADNKGDEMKKDSTRRDFLKTAGVAGAAVSAVPRSVFGAGGLSSPGGRRKRPNMVYLFSDEHRYQSMSFTEMPELKTPNMEKMAERGTSFVHAISNNPVCVPHRCMLLSGQWPHRTGAVDNQGGLAAWDRTLGHVFHEAGYVTGYTGKWHAGGYAAQAGFDWHMHWGNTDDHWDSHWTDLHGSGRREECKTYNAAKMTDQALEFIDTNAGGEKPFFLMVSWNPPHYIFTDAPEDKLALYPDPDALPWRANARAQDQRWPDYQGYHAHISAIDEEIERVYAKLDELGVLDDTIVIYTSDHGSMMNSHGLRNKRYPHDESCRVPFLVTGPGVPAGQVREEMFGTIDIFPTLSALAGIPIPGFCDGQDFSRNIYGLPGASNPETQLLMHVTNSRIGRNGNVVPPREELINYHTPFFRGVRSRRYTYAVGCTGEWVLWDNLEDPYQQRNRIDDPAYGEVREAMRKELDGWLARAENPFLHEAYLAMPLPDRILQQAQDGAVSLPLHSILMRLKLTPEQFARMPEIHNRYYDGRGFPRSGLNWRSAAQEAAEEIRGILTDEQRPSFEKMLARDPMIAG